MCAKWTNINGEYNPSCAAWDGAKWYNLGGLTFSNGITAAVLHLKIYRNKLYVFGGVEKADTINTYGIAVWNDTIWCGVKMINNTGLQNVPIENYKDQWYFVGSTTMVGDTIPLAPEAIGDTINGLGIYIGNNGKLERDCFDKPLKEVPTPKPDGELYPIPTSDKINFSLSQYFGTTCNLKIISSLGQTLSSFQNINTNSNLSIEAYSEGVYLFIFYNNQTRKTFKVLKQ
jgi:hypothetical protein